MCFPQGCTLYVRVCPLLHSFFTVPPVHIASNTLIHSVPVKLRTANAQYKADGRDDFTESYIKANDVALGIKVGDFDFSARSHAETTTVYKPRPQPSASRWPQKEKETWNSRPYSVSKPKRN